MIPGIHTYDTGTLHTMYPAVDSITLFLAVYLINWSMDTGIGTSKVTCLLLSLSLTRHRYRHPSRPRLTCIDTVVV